MKRSFGVCLILAALSWAVIGCMKESKDSTNKGENGTPTPSGTAPPSDGTLTAVNFDGVEAAIAANKGKVVLIDCWATWCGPCVASFPKLVEKHKHYAEKGLAVMSLSVDDQGDTDEVIAFLQKNGATFTNMHLQRDAAAQKKMQQRFLYKGSIPHAVLFDKTGERVWAGHPMDPKLESKIVAELDK